MSISPPSDIVLEVARAADPTALAAATERLREIAVARGRDTDAPAFGSMLADAAPAPRPLVPLPPVEPDLARMRSHFLAQSTAPIGAGPDLPASRVAGAPETPAQQFEAQVLAQVVETILPDTPDLYGEGTAGSVWRGFLAQEIGAELARAGGLGIASAVAARHPELAQVSAATNVLWPEYAPPAADVTTTASLGPGSNAYFDGFFRT